MKIGIQTAGPDKTGTIAEAYRLIRESGFEAADVNIDQLPLSLYEGSDRDVAEAYRPYLDASKEYGIDNYQAHALFPPFVGDPDKDAFLLQALVKTIAGADSIGCHNLVVHPAFLQYDRQLTFEDEFEINIERYSALIPAAKQYGVRILLENMFTGHTGKIYGASCSDPSEACRYIDELNGIAGGRLFGFCFDTGHSLLTGRDVRRAMNVLGDRIFAFHFHDNDGVYDLHLAPYMGILDWDRFVGGLRDIGFDSTMCFETFNVFNRVDSEIYPDVLRVIARTGRMFAERAAR